MKTIILLALLTLSFTATGQTFDLVRSVTTSSVNDTVSDTTSGESFIHTGNMVINGNNVVITDTICSSIISTVCGTVSESGTILFSDSTQATILKDSGRVSNVKIMSFYPTIILFEAFKSGAVWVTEYKAR